MPKPPGYFLIRVSESRIGYTLSYRVEDRCRHFMIDALEDGRYIIVGENRSHQCLQDLVDFHRRTPIMPYSEMLTVACGQSSNDKTDYAELLFTQSHPIPTTNLQQNISLHISRNPAAPQEDIPPALPHRPNNLRIPAGFSQGRLYPSLEEEFPRDSLLPPTPPVPMPRKNQPPQLPIESPLPPLKQNQACVRTVSAPDSRFTHSATVQAFSTQRNQEAKPSVVSNLKNLRKKFGKKRSPSQELMNAEINVGATERSGNTEHEYQEITGEQSKPFSNTCPDIRLTNERLPHEYRQPPPFAPGY
ncbi:hematopoietic SH2 domain-containing protein homolog [Xyrichtys novacula]|nr:hematopoietic SH2 domain-containing protein homolog [Xyrichtys novacula]